MEVERVQILADRCKSTDAIPEEFIRSEQDQPGLSTYKGGPADVPVIDVGSLNEEQLMQAVCSASREWGIFQVVNHGIPAEVISEMQLVGKQFFELPQEEKEKYAVDPASGSIEGYGTKLQKDLEGKKAWTDYLFHNVSPPSRINYEKWPKNPAEYRKANEEYTKHMKIIMNKINESLSVGLGLDKNVIKDAIGGEDIDMLQKINYYPPCPRPDLVLGVVAHTDMSALTLLLPNDVPGLQVFKDDHWYEVNYVPGAIVVHVGDQIEILSNGKYKSVLHRVTVNKEKVRMSWPVFCSPPPKMVVGPLPQLVNDENPAKFKTKKYKDYQHCKLNKLPQ